MDLKNKFIAGIINNIPDSYLNGDITNSLSSIVNFSYSKVNAKFLTSVLNQKGIFVSNGSAYNCSKDNLSHVLLAMHNSNEIASSAIRFSFGEENTLKEINYVIQILASEINKIRENL